LIDESLLIEDCRSRIVPGHAGIGAAWGCSQSSIKLNNQTPSQQSTIINQQCCSGIDVP